MTTGHVGATGASGAGTIGGAGGAIAGAAGAIAGAAGAAIGCTAAPPAICVEISLLILGGTCEEVAHDPLRFQFHTHPCIPISVGAVILGTAISPHHVQFHVHVAGATAVDGGGGAMTAAGSALCMALAGAALDVAGAASGPATGGAGAACGAEAP